MSVSSKGRDYLLRPEAIESFYYLYQLTNDDIYKAYGYEIYKNILIHSRSNEEENFCGFSVVDDVTYVFHESFC